MTLPEETPVNELVDTAYSLEDEVGVSLGPVVVNGLYPPLDGLGHDPAAAGGGGPSRGRPGRAGRHGRRPRPSAGSGPDCRPRRSTAWPRPSPSPSSRLPYLFSTDPGPDELEILAGALGQGIGDLTTLAEP